MTGDSAGLTIQLWIGFGQLVGMVLLVGMQIQQVRTLTKLVEKIETKLDDHVDKRDIHLSAAEVRMIARAREN